MKNLFLMCFIFGFLSSFTWAQLGYIPLNVDYATFKGAGENTYLEIYLSFFQQDLQYAEEDTVFYAKFSHTISITKDDSVYFKTTRNYKSATTQTRVNITNQFMDVFPVELPSGEYSLLANIIDKNSNKIGEYRLNVEVPDFNNNLCLSKLEIGTKINPKGDDSNFSLKNNVKIYPNASKTFTINNPIMYFYFEGYQLNLDADGNSKYTYNYYISDMDGKRIREYPDKSKTAKSNTIAEATGVNVIALPSGSYFLTVELKDLIANQSALMRKKFFIYKPDRKKSAERIAAKIEGYEEYVAFGRDQLIDEFNKAKYVAVPEEIDIFEKLENTEGMKKFLAQFWKRRDPSPSTPLNEYKQMYFENLRLADANYSSYFKEGWRTDRGRVILIYGKPDEIERNPSALDTQPFEIWYYYSLEGGAQFVFADISGNGNYELLHSTYRNEIKDPDWRIRIEKVGSRGYNSNFDRY